MTQIAHQRGLTVLEVVMASALLVTLASIVIGTLSFIEGVHMRDLHRLNATEVAHRVIAQYIDDPTLLPDEDLPLQQGDFLYRYVMREDIIELDDDGTTRRVASKRRALDVPATEQFGNLLRQILVQVYIDDDRVPERLKLTPVASLERLYSPIAGREEDAVLEWIKALLQRVQSEQRDQRRNKRNGANR